MTPAPATLREAAVHVLTTADAAEKAALTATYAARRRDGGLDTVGNAVPPDRPTRPARPALLAPRDMPKRGLGTVAGRAAFIHAIAHIELNAIDLAWDIVARFAADDMPAAFHDDWVAVANDEARHFTLLTRRLAELGYAYGDFPGHDGLWQAATETADDLMARLALVPMVLEARGLDTVPDAARRLEIVGDAETAAILTVIGEEEIAHVAAGTRWFHYLCDRSGIEPIRAFHDMVRSRFRATLKPPFNIPARAQAGMNTAYFDPLSH